MTDEHLFDALREQRYPLTVSEDAAEAIVRCIRNIMDLVHEDDKVLVRGDYDAATSALFHPAPSE